MDRLIIGGLCLLGGGLFRLALHPRLVWSVVLNPGFYFMRRHVVAVSIAIPVNVLVTLVLFLMLR